MPAARFASIDALRGAAIVWMTAFHFCFDLAYFRWLDTNFYTHPFWTTQRTLIVSLFVFCAGLGQAAAVAQGQGWPRFWKRWAQVAACAVLVSLGSYWMFPRSFIFFGVLHGIAAMLVVVRLTAGWGRWLWLAGALAIASKFIAQQAHSIGAAPEFLNEKAWAWLGLAAQPPVTEDFVPLVPWLGAMGWGVAAGQWLLRHRREQLASPLAPAFAPLAWLGRWSLTWYMVHQPVLIGAMMLARQLAAP